MSLMFRASRFCIRASETREALAQWASGSKTLMLSPEVFVIIIAFPFFVMGLHLMYFDVSLTGIRTNDITAWTRE